MRRYIGAGKQVTKMSQFQFLKQDFEQVFEHVRKAETRTLRSTRGMFLGATKHRDNCKLDLQTREISPPLIANLATLISNADFIAHVGQSTYKAGYIKTLGNFASHDGKKTHRVRRKSTLKELFHVSYWLSRNYAVTKRPEPNITFDESLLERSHAIKASTLAKIKEFEKDYKKLRDENAQLEAQLQETEQGRLQLETQLEQKMQEIAEFKAANQLGPDSYNYSEAETRSNFIDLLLRDVGWFLDQEMIVSLKCQECHRAVV